VSRSVLIRLADNQAETSHAYNNATSLDHCNAKRKNIKRCDIYFFRSRHIGSQQSVFNFGVLGVGGVRPGRIPHLQDSSFIRY
jgi:hypothetical protein